MHRLYLFSIAFNSHLHRRFLPQIPKQYPHGILRDTNLNRCFLDFSVKQYYTIISGVVGTAHSRPGTAKQVGWLSLRCRRKAGSSASFASNVMRQRPQESAFRGVTGEEPELLHTGHCLGLGAENWLAGSGRDPDNGKFLKQGAPVITERKCASFKNVNKEAETTTTTRKPLIICDSFWSLQVKSELSSGNNNWACRHRAHGRKR